MRRTLSDTKWMARGNCAGKSPDFFFPSDGVGVEAARKVCETCPVKDICLEYALANRIDHGVWGGTSERERRRIIKRRAAERRVLEQATASDHATESVPTV